MKRKLALLLCGVMCVSLFAGCGKGGSESSGKDGKTTLTIGIPQNANVEDYDTNAYTLWLEETTGYNLEFELFASATDDNKSQISTRIAGNKKLPDILWNFSLGSEVIADYGKDGYFLDLASYYEDKEKSAIFWDRLAAAYPEDKDQNYIIQRLTNRETGAMYAFPRIEKTVIDTMQYQVYINQVWLDKLGLVMPSDTESLYNVLKAFATKDPNGNGKADEIPLLARNANAGSGQGIGWLTSMFIGVNEATFFNVDDNGQLYLPWITDEYRQALIYINKLQSEGLLPESCWNMEVPDMKNLINPTDGVNTVGVFVGHPSLILEVGNEANYEYQAMPLWGYAVSVADAYENSCFITADCENPDAAWDLFMTMCSEEGAMRQRYGEKGVDWVDADEGTTSFIGRDAEFKLVNDIWGTQNNQIWGVVNATILINSENETRQVSEDDSKWDQHKLKIMGDAYRYFTAAAEAKPLTVMPTLNYTEEEKELTKVERNNCATYINTSRAKFCCGTNGADASDDKQWNEYLAKLKSLGMEKWMKQAQEIYDATLK